MSDPHAPVEVDILGTLRDLAVNGKSERTRLDALKQLAAYRPPADETTSTAEHEVVHTVIIEPPERERTVLVCFRYAEPT